MSESSVVEPIAFEFDQPRRLLFTLKSFRALDRVMGEVGLVPIQNLLQQINFQTLERVLWAGLLHEEPTLTVSLVSKRLDTYIENGGDITDLLVAANRALNESQIFKTAKGRDEGKTRPEQTA